MSTSVKGLGLHLTFQANKLVCYFFTDAGRRHKTPGSETKVTVRKALAFCSFVSVPSVPTPRSPSTHRWAKGMSAHIVGGVARKEH